MAFKQVIRLFVLAVAFVVASVHALDATSSPASFSQSQTQSSASSPNLLSLNEQGPTSASSSDSTVSAPLFSTRSQDASSFASPSSVSVDTTSASISSIASSSTTPSSTSDSLSASSTSATASPSQTAIPEDVATMTSRRLEFIVAGASDATANITSWLATLGPDGKWPDAEVDYTTGCDARRANWPAQSHWIRLLRMAAAWHGGVPDGEQFVQSSSLLSAISRAMDFWFANDFQDQACLDNGGNAACPCGTPGLWNTNWFSNIILIPNLVAQTCLLVNTNLTDTQHGNCTHITSRTYGTFDHRVGGLGIATGANLLDIARIGIDEGLLNVNVSQLTDAYRRIHGEAIVQNAIKADGIRADGSFGQHGGVLYNGNYGKDYANDVLLLEIIAGGTQFAAPQTNRDAFATLMDGDQWMIFRNTLTNVLHWDFSALGRFISFPVIDAQATGSININITEIQQLGQLWNSSTLTTVHDRLASPSNDANVGGLSGNRMFFANDYMVQRGPGYVTTVKMYSPRTKNTECLNDQNPFGFHLSDGTVYTYMKGNEYEDIEAAWDWNLIPGTTVDYNATTLSCATAEHTGVNAFAGGVSDGHRGVAAMHFTNPATNALSWQKAWFFLDDDVQHVLVPTITSTFNASVLSVLDQKRHSGPVLVNGVQPGAQTNFSRPASLWHDSVGYLFDPVHSPVELAVQVGEKTGNWSALGISAQGLETVDLFAAWINHGIGNDVRVPLAYKVFPAVSQGKFERKATQTRVQTVRNDADVSAVYDSVHRTAMFVFWNAAGGSVEFFPSPFEASITVNSTANTAVIYDVDSGNVTVSDPSQTLQLVDLTLTANDFGKPPPGWGSELTKRLHFSLPSGGLAGQSVSQTL